MESKDYAEKVNSKRKKKKESVPKRKHKGNTRLKNKKRTRPVKISKKKKAFIFLWNILFYVLMLSALAGSVMMAVMQQQDKSLAGYRMFGVLTNSMVSPGDKIKSGGFRAGDLLIIRETPEDEIKVGDVITYHPSTDPINKSTNYLTHRVVEIKEEFGNEKGIYFVTRGDANQTDDMPISADSLVGKVTWKVPKIAGVLNFIRENLLVSVIFIVSVLGFVWVMQNYILTSKTTTKKKQKKKRRKRK